MRQLSAQPPGANLVGILAWVFAIGLPGVIGWWRWQRWGRKRFPLPPPSEQQARCMSIRTVGAAAAVAAALAVSCSSPSPQSAACRQAAEDQVFAEQHWARLIEQHVHDGHVHDDHAHDDAALSEDAGSTAAVTAHNESAGRLLGARLDVIVAEAETRRRCG